MDHVVLHRPRNVDWKRAAALLYGDWGTSKAYVIGLAFVAAGFSCLPIIVAVCVLTAVVAYNYVIVCKHFPDGGGVYSAAKNRSRFLAVMGALLLVADMVVTASLSGWAAMSYFGVSNEKIAWVTMGVILGVGVINSFGPKHSGSLAVSLAIPTVIIVLIIIGLSLPYLTTVHFEASHQGFREGWVAFVGVILALSGVEAIANLTGVMKLNRNSSSERPQVTHTASCSIWLVAMEVVLGTILLGWAMLSLPNQSTSLLVEHKEDMLRYLGQEYGSLVLGAHLGQIFGIIVGVIVGLLLVSAVNTAVVALIGLIYMMARDGEMPQIFTRLNRYGVPILPLLIAVLLPILVLLLVQDFESLAGLYAIGVVGAIAVNLGSCSFNWKLPLLWYERSIMGLTFFVLFAIEVTIAKTKPDALFFAVCILGTGLGLRAYVQKRAGLETLLVHKDVAAAVAPESLAHLQLNLGVGQKIMVAARGLTPVLRYALEEARLRQGALYVLFVKELAVTLPAPLTENIRPRWQDDPQAAAIMCAAIDLAQSHGVTVIPLYVISENSAATIVDLAATLGVDFLMLGSSHRRFMTQLLKGDVTTEVANNLPENIQLVIHG